MKTSLPICASLGLIASGVITFMDEPKYRYSAAGTYGLFQSMNNLAEIGYSQIDLEGVNSPERGHFKLSFGGSLDQYYELHLSNSDVC